jgi:dTDP-4-amino-4,6-dideoxygalactose transaminase
MPWFRQDAVSCALTENLRTSTNSRGRAAVDTVFAAAPQVSCKNLHENENAQDHGMLLPLYHQMTEEDQDRVVEALRQACSMARSV